MAGNGAPKGKYLITDMFALLNANFNVMSTRTLKLMSASKVDANVCVYVCGCFALLVSRRFVLFYVLCSLMFLHVFWFVLFCIALFS